MSDDDDLQAAFALISDFKNGVFEPGTEISKRQLHLVRLLLRELLPDRTAADEELPNLIQEIAQEDSRWNHKAMQVISAISSLSDAEREGEAAVLWQSFSRECPSRWYREIVSNA